MPRTTPSDLPDRAGRRSTRTPFHSVSGPVRALLAAVVALTMLVALPGAEAATQQSSPARDLATAVERALLSSGARSISASVDADGYGDLVRLDPNRVLPPASTQKAFGSLASLVARGDDAVYTTEIAATSVPVDGVLYGPLYLVAGGDPYLSRAHLIELARQVKAAGIDTITGPLLVDDSRYDATRGAPGWARSYVGRQSGPLAAFAVDRNTVRRSPDYLRDPVLVNAEVFRDFLRGVGVDASNEIDRSGRPAWAQTVTTWDSVALRYIVARTLKNSDNFGAEMLVKELGVQLRGRGTTADGLAAIAQVLSPFSVGNSVDGSGLSNRNRQTSAIEMGVLHQATDVTRTGTFEASLPVACVDGTLRTRMCGTAGAGKVRAKTGTLAGTRSLAGYTTTADGRRVWFSFLLDGVRDGGRATRAMDRAAVLLSAHTG